MVLHQVKALQAPWQLPWLDMQVCSSGPSTLLQLFRVPISLDCKSLAFPLHLSCKACCCECMLEKMACHSTHLREAAAAPARRDYCHPDIEQL